jgi:hypothetical protein
MEDFKSGFNPLSFENLTMFLTISVIMGTLLVLVILTDKLIIPRINPESRFVKWWKKHIININPFER